MKIALLHYHLRPGGVTTVIRNAQRALAPRHDVRVFSDFGYDDTPARSRARFVADARALAGQLRERLRGVDVLHTHNIGLGKHPRLACAVKLLAETGAVSVINQVHDFPEDDRPAQLRALRYCTGRRDDEFWRSFCYYDRPRVVWATLTTRDANKLAERGVRQTRIFVLPNPVDDERFTRAAPSSEELENVARRLAVFAARRGFPCRSGKRLLLAPMKVMVRKNNAEAIDLVNRLPGYQLLITLDGSSPGDRAYSARLKRMIRRDRLPVIIGFGHELGDPLPLFHLAHAIVTTSKAEGFGYTFIEGWLCGKLVIGRDIPEVTRDFIAAGMDLRHLYRELDAAAVERMKRLLAHRPRSLIRRNRAVVLENYSLHAYARRYAALLRPFRVHA
jgi:glycosyltransferase involved in cell wall biosynthesis